MVTSLFPEQVHERLFENFQTGDAVESTKTKLRSFLNDKNGGALEDGNEDFMYKTKPIADLFPVTTIMFADIAGFTAWSSVRESSQVFTLLETLYKAFYDIAVKRRVFLETVGDC
jgi:class 3 adenylate cyclase